MSNTEKKENQIPWWVKNIILIGLTGVFSYKVIQPSLNFQFDFPAFLSLLLALFSVALATMFYFKATDSSNKFYVIKVTQHLIIHPFVLHIALDKTTYTQYPSR